MYTISGKLIYSKQCSILGNKEQKVTFEMPSGASNGIYLVQIKTKEFAKTVKLVFQQ
ncbi:T9SS type A sorting domain-containing protein [Flavobacterium sp.]|uniref:T9SS type A sorting domain-containing protein n=1 Tax=Flavobacterium sp. TaxID=239 RepID=UPI0038D48517